MYFQKQSIEDLWKIRPLLEERLPVTCMILNLVDMTLSGKYSEEGDYVEIYRYVDDTDNNAREVEKDNLFINAIISPKFEIPYCVLYAPEEVKITQRMLDAFCSLYDWNKPQEFGALPQKFVENLKNIFDKNGGTATFNPADDMYLPIEDALKINLDNEKLSSEFEIDKLTSENATKVNSYWRYGCKGGEVNIAKAIRAYGGVGVFRKTPDCDRSNSNLVSWVVFLRIGTFNALHTLEEYRGKGLGAWTMKAAAKLIAENGLIPLCEIEPYNSQSRRLVERIGYKLIHTIHWVMYKPKVT